MGACLIVIVPAAVPSARAVAQEIVVAVAAVIFCSPTRFRFLTSEATVAVATPPATTMVHERDPKPLIKQASNSAMHAPATPFRTGAPGMSSRKIFTEVSTGETMMLSFLFMGWLARGPRCRDR